MADQGQVIDESVIPVLEEPSETENEDSSETEN